MTEEMKTPQTTQRRMMRMIISCACRERRRHRRRRTPRPNSEPVDDTTEHNNQDLNEHEESSRDANRNPCFDEISEDNPEEELEPWVNFITRATRKADVFFF